MMARRLAIRQGCHVVVTAGELGLWWSDGQTVRRVPAVPVQVRDVCGAGDTVLATLGVVAYPQYWPAFLVLLALLGGLVVFA